MREYPEVPTWSEEGLDRRKLREIIGAEATLQASKGDVTKLAREFLTRLARGADGNVAGVVEALTQEYGYDEMGSTADEVARSLQELAAKEIHTLGEPELNRVAQLIKEVERLGQSEEPDTPNDWRQALTGN